MTLALAAQEGLTLQKLLGPSRGALRPAQVRCGDSMQALPAVRRCCTVQAVASMVRRHAISIMLLGPLEPLLQGEGSGQNAVQVGTCWVHLTKGA